jgi:hypothetical protein
MVYTPELKIQTEGNGIFGIDVLKLADYAEYYSNFRRYNFSIYVYLVRKNF